MSIVLKKSKEKIKNLLLKSRISFYTNRILFLFKTVKKIEKLKI